MLKLLLAPVIALLLICWQTPASGQPARHSPVAPVEPSEILKLLPVAPKGWKLTGSTATNSFSDWLKTSAVRTLQYTAPAAAGAPIPPVQTTRVSITDTGYFPQFLSEFASFRAGKENDVEKLVLSGLPAIRISRPPVEILSILINGRFVVQIRTDQQPPRATESWLKLIDVARIAAAPVGAAQIPQPVTITRIDEVNPAKSSSYPMSWTSEEQQQQTAIAVEAEEANKAAAQKPQRP